MRIQKFCRILIFTLGLGALVAGLSLSAFAEEDFFGKLGLSLQDDVSVQLKLTSDQKAKLSDLLENRESDAVGPAMEIRNLSPQERSAKLAEFRKESEKRAAAILSPEQQTKLEQIRIRRLGMASLAEPAMAEKAGLDDEQKNQVAEILKFRETQLTKSDEKTANIVRAETERKLAAILNDKQKTAWETISGGDSPRNDFPKPIDIANPNLPKSGPPLADLSKADKSMAGSIPPEKMEKAPPIPGNFPNIVEKPTESTFPEKSEIKPAAAQPPLSASLPKTNAVNDKEPKKHSEKLRFNFRYAPWKQVLDWFAEEANMSLVMDAPPPGSCNIIDDKEYTPSEALDQINFVLLLRGYMVIRNERMLIVVNKADGIPASLVQTISPDTLDQRGKYEIVRVLFNLDKLSPEEAELEIKKLMSSDGVIVSLPKSRQILVTDTGGNLRSIRSLIQRVEDPDNVLSGQIRTIELKQAPPELVLPIVKQMLDIPEDKNASSDGSLRLAIDPSGRRIIATGKPEKISRLEEIIKIVDVVKPGGPQVGIATTPQLVIYPITTADPTSVLSVLQTLLQGQPDVRLALDPKTNSVVALARPGDHATIRATLDDMQRDSRRMEVIRLRTVDPQLALAAITKLFGITTDPKTTSTSAPQVQAEATTRQIFVQGTEGQIAQIRQLLEKMGETDISAVDMGNENKVRMLSISPRSARSVLDQIQGVWPVAHKNKIREVAPSSVIPSMTPGEGGVPSDIPQHLINRLREEAPKGPAPPRRELPNMSNPSSTESMPEAESNERESEESHAAPPSAKRKSDNTTVLSNGAKIYFAAMQLPAKPQSADPIQPLAVSSGDSQKAAADSATKVNPNEGAPIIVSVGPGGVMIASEDTKALDEFERLFTSLAGVSATGTPPLTIFYLKHAKAAVVAETLDTIFGGGTLQGDGGGGSLLGDIAGAAMGEAGGGLVGSLLNMGGGGSIKPSGSVKITPDPRLNALVVQANPTDVDTIEQLLKILDQKDSPEEVLIAPKPRRIPLYNTDADKMAEIVKSTFQNRLESAAAQGGNQPNPMELLQALRGGGGRRGGGGGRGQAPEIEKMTVTADTRTNSLIVAASDALFQDVKTLVEELDVISVESTEATQIITLHHASSAAIESALKSIAGDNVQITRTSASATGSRPGGSQQGSPFGQGMGGRRQFGGFPGGGFGGFPGGGFQGGGFQGGGFPGGGFQGGGFPGGGFGANPGGGQGSPNFGGGGGNRGGGRGNRQGGN